MSGYWFKINSAFFRKAMLQFQVINFIFVVNTDLSECDASVTNNGKVLLQSGEIIVRPAMNRCPIEYKKLKITTKSLIEIQQSLLRTANQNGYSGSKTNHYKKRQVFIQLFQEIAHLVRLKPPIPIIETP